MNLFKLDVLLLLLVASSVNGQTCSFTKDFGSGVALDQSGLEQFDVDQGAITSCSLSCDTGINTATFLYLRYGDIPNILLNDAKGNEAVGCGINLVLSSPIYQTRLGWYIVASTHTNYKLTCTCSKSAVASSCFSGDMTVEVLGREEPVAMRDLEVGDMVKSAASNSYQKIYSFGHHDDSKETEYVQLFTEAGEVPLELSPDHFVFVDEADYLFGVWPQQKAVRADTVKVGDVLLLAGKSQKATVTNIESVVKGGAYMPLTTDGTILVNGIQASSYVSIAHNAPSVIENFAFYWFSEQNLSHWWMAPYRMMCMGVSSHFCSTNPDMMDEDEDGILKWLLLGRTYATTANSMSFFVHHLLGIPTAIVFGFLLFAETIFGPTLAPSALLALACFALWYVLRRQK